MGTKVPCLVFYSGFDTVYTTRSRPLAIALTHRTCPRSMAEQFAKEVS